MQRAMPAADTADVDLDLLRGTPEYKAAWEIELWKKREQAAFSKRLEDEMRHVVDERLEAAKAREAEMAEEHRRRLRDLQLLEATKTREQAEFREKRQLLDDCERALRKRKEDLEREYTLRKQEWETKIRRNKEEAAHKISLEHLKHTQLSATVDDLRHKLKSVEEKHRALWEEVTRSKRDDLQRHPADALKEAADAVDVRHRALAAAVEREHAQREEALRKKVSALTTQNGRLREQVGQLRLRLQTSSSRAAQATHDAAMLTTETLCLTHTALLHAPAAPAAAADRAAAAGGEGGERGEDAERGSSRRLQELCAALRFLPDILGALTPEAAAELSEARKADILEVARLGREKERLLGTGCYAEEDAVVRALSEQQQRLVQGLL